MFTYSHNKYSEGHEVGKELKWSFSFDFQSVLYFQAKQNIHQEAWFYSSRIDWIVSSGR